jgi:hypothetical protein
MMSDSDGEEPRTLNYIVATRSASSSTIRRADGAPTTNRTLSLNSTAATPYLWGFLFGSLAMFFLLAIVPSLVSAYSLGSRVSRNGYGDAPKVPPSPPYPSYFPCIEDGGRGRQTLTKAGEGNSWKGESEEENGTSSSLDNTATGTH